MFLGFLFAVLSSIFLSLYIVPKKFNKTEPFVFTFFIGMGYFITSITFVLIYSFFAKINEPIFSIYSLYSLLDGLLWTLASICYLKAIDLLGITKASTFKNLQGPISSILFLFILSEYKNLNIWLVFLSLLFIFLSQVLFNVNKKGGKLNFKGIFLGILASVFFSFNSLVRKICSINGLIFAEQIYASFVICIVTFALLVIKNKVNKQVLFNKKNFLGLLSGFFYFFASTFMVLSYSYISGTITSTITKLSGLFSVFIGIVFFKEINFKKHWLKIILGCISITLAVFLLLFA